MFSPSLKPITSFKLVAVALVVLAGATTSTPARADAPRTADQLQANAVASFRQARFSEAYGRFIALADAGHAPAAAMALWMFQNGPTVFGKDWDSSQEQLTAWAALARQPAPVLTARNYQQPKAVAVRSVR